MPTVGSAVAPRNVVPGSKPALEPGAQPQRRNGRQGQQDVNHVSDSRLSFAPVTDPVLSLSYLASRYHLELLHLPRVLVAQRNEPVEDNALIGHALFISSGSSSNLTRVRLLSLSVSSSLLASGDLVLLTSRLPRAFALFFGCTTDYTAHFADPDVQLDWSDILQVILPTSASALSSVSTAPIVPTCPICLSEPTAPRMVSSRWIKIGVEQSLIDNLTARRPSVVRSSSFASG